MFILFLFWFLSVSAIGFTLLNYSSDGDRKNSSFLTKYATNETSNEESILRLKELSRSIIEEVNWNTNLFVALCSSFGFFCLCPYISSENKFIAWFLSVLLVFGLQDLVTRWKQSHRKNKIYFEKIAILDKLLFQTKNYSNKII